MNTFSAPPPTDRDDAPRGVGIAIEMPAMPGVQGRLFNLPSGATTIGSGPRCSLRLPGAAVRPLHCVLSRGPQGVIARRWAEATELNGQPFDQATIEAGDRLSLAGVELVFHAPTPEVESPGVDRNSGTPEATAAPEAKAAAEPSSAGGGEGSSPATPPVTPAVVPPHLLQPWLGSLPDGNAGANTETQSPAAAGEGTAEATPSQQLAAADVLAQPVASANQPADEDEGGAADVWAAPGGFATEAAEAETDKPMPAGGHALAPQAVADTRLVRAAANGRTRRLLTLLRAERSRSHDLQACIAEAERRVREADDRRDNAEQALAAATATTEQQHAEIQALRDERDAASQALFELRSSAMIADTRLQELAEQVTALGDELERRDTAAALLDGGVAPTADATEAAAGTVSTADPEADSEADTQAETTPEDSGAGCVPPQPSAGQERDAVPWGLASGAAAEPATLDSNQAYPEPASADLWAGAADYGTADAVAPAAAAAAPASAEDAAAEASGVEPQAAADTHAGASAALDDLWAAVQQPPATQAAADPSPSVQPGAVGNGTSPSEAGGREGYGTAAPTGGDREADPPRSEPQASE
ncbi:MAG: FHA domain-containing protein, partial [Planctomycetota bacterium]